MSFNQAVACPKRWTAGFLAGDGCVQNKRVSYTQALKGKANLEYILGVWPRGKLYARPKRNPRHQDQLDLVYTGTKAAEHLDDLRPECAYKPAVDATHNPEKLSLDFVGGFFAAEGHVGITVRGYPVITCSQKDPAVLWAMRDALGAGNVYAAGPKAFQYRVQSRGACLAVAKQLFGRAGAKDHQLGLLVTYLEKGELKGIRASRFRAAISRRNGGCVDLKPFAGSV